MFTLKGKTPLEKWNPTRGSRFFGQSGQSRGVVLCLACAFVSTFLLFAGGPDDYSLRSFSTAWGFGHFFCFALWAYLYSVLRPDIKWRRYSVEVLAITFVLGGTAELIQPFFGRNALWSDVGQDLVGAVLAMVFFTAHRKQTALMKRRLLQVPLVLILLLYLFPLGQALIDDAVAWRQFPMLSGFETPFERTRWSKGGAHAVVEDPVSAGKRALRVELTTTQYSGIALNHFPRDWSDYNAVRLAVCNVSAEPLKLNVRIHDVHHNQDYDDRFNTRFVLQPGWNHLRVDLADAAAAPKNRQLDLKRIGALGLFVAGQEKNRTIIVDDVRLVK